MFGGSSDVAGSAAVTRKGCKDAVRASPHAKAACTHRARAEAGVELRERRQRERRQSPLVRVRRRRAGGVPDDGQEEVRPDRARRNYLYARAEGADPQGQARSPQLAGSEGAPGAAGATESNGHDSPSSPALVRGTSCDLHA